MQDCRFKVNCRIIPTCVGKSNLRICAAAMPKDHPHVRGEKKAGRITAPAVLGSSPRAWGKGQRLDVVRGGPRIIPTCVGKRPPNARPRTNRADHPHVRGEKLKHRS